MKTCICCFLLFAFGAHASGDQFENSIATAKYLRTVMVDSGSIVQVFCSAKNSELNVYYSEGSSGARVTLGPPGPRDREYNIRIRPVFLKNLRKILVDYLKRKDRDERAAEDAAAGLLLLDEPELALFDARWAGSSLK